MIPNEAVEAGVKAVFAIREAGTPLLNERDVIRAALEAALPHLLAGKRDQLVKILDPLFDQDGEADAIADMFFAHPQKGGEG